MAKIEMGKEYVNGRGIPVRILAVDLPAPYSVAGFVQTEDGGTLERYTAEGNVFDTRPCPGADLQEKKELVWTALYEVHNNPGHMKFTDNWLYFGGCCYSSLEEAKQGRKNAVAYVLTKKGSTEFSEVVEFVLNRKD